MSHEVETMAYANAVPWHGLGAKVEGDLTSKQFLKAAGLDWKVEMKPLKAQMDDGDLINVPGRYALVRDTDRKVMTVAGKAWKPVQNSEILDFMNKYVEAGGATMETAGSLRGGTIVWALAKLQNDFEVKRGDTVRGYLLLTGSHRVGISTTARATSVRVVCANTLAMAEGSSQAQYRQNHLTEFDTVKAQEAIELANEDIGAFAKRAKTLSKLKLNIEDAVRKVIVPVFEPGFVPGEKADKEAKSIWDAIMEPEIMPKKVAGIVHSINSAPGAVPGNGWGVLNGVTHWCDHVQGHNAGTRMMRSWMGDYGRNKLKVEEKLLELAS